MSEAERTASIEQSRNICSEYCGVCPTHMGKGETQLIFCIVGKSNNISEFKGCLCGSCPVQRDWHMRWDSYCIKGAARELSAAGKKHGE
jgi:hypothetical protein